MASAFSPEAFTFENFMWGVSTVRARAHAPLELDALALVPLADSVRHHSLSAGMHLHDQVTLRCLNLYLKF